MKGRLIVALDVGDHGRVGDCVTRLLPELGMFKVGKQLFTHAGPQAVRLVQDLGGEVFLDLKFHDIPNTVAKAAAEATRLGVKMFNVHASVSLEMMRATVKEVRRVCQQEKRRRPIMLAVTVLTSLNQDDLKRVGIDGRMADQVVRLALLTQQAGMDGVVASPHEGGAVRLDVPRRSWCAVRGEDIQTRRTMHLPNMPSLPVAHAVSLWVVLAVASPAGALDTPAERVTLAGLTHVHVVVDAQQRRPQLLCAVSRHPPESSARGCRSTLR